MAGSARSADPILMVARAGFHSAKGPFRLLKMRKESVHREQPAERCLPLFGGSLPAHASCCQFWHTRGNEGGAKAAFGLSRAECEKQNAVIHRCIIDFNSRRRKMKPNLNFASCLILQKSRPRIMKAITCMALSIGVLISAPAHSGCYDVAHFGSFEFSKFGFCSPSTVSGSTGTYAPRHELDLNKAYEYLWGQCHSAVNFEWSCPVHQKYTNAPQIQNTWKREVGQCRQYFTNQFNRYKGKMCRRASW